MIRIITLKDVEQIKNPYLAEYVRNLVTRLLTEYRNYCADSLEAIGAIFVLEDTEDWNLYSEMGLSVPPEESRFEWIEDIGNGLCNGCIVIDNDRGIDIIGKQEYFKQFKGAFM